MPKGVYTRVSSPVFCNVSACFNPHHSGGLCSLHYQRKRAGLAFDLPRYTKEKLKRPKPNRKTKQLARGWISRGYRFYLLPDGSRISEQRVVMQEVLGRKLMPSEIVHHIDEDKLNNDPSNLVVVTRAQHRAIHNG